MKANNRLSQYFLSKQLIKMKYKFSTILIILLIFNSNYTISQKKDNDNPRTWTHFKIFAKTTDDSLFYQLQDEMNINPKMESYTIFVNIESTKPEQNYVVFGNDEYDSNAYKISWNKLNQNVQNGLLDWSALNKVNLEKVLIWHSVFFNVKKPIKIISPANDRQVHGTVNYINPYLQLFGGQPLGMPIKHSIGFSFGIGTKFSGPFESDQISAGLHLFGASFSYITRLQGLNTHELGSDRKDNLPWKQYNNIFSPVNAWEISYVIPLFSNFLEIGMMGDFGDTNRSGPLYTFYEKGDSSKPMPNNIMRGKIFNLEFRYPFRLFGATVSQLYAAYYAKEVNIGLFAREMKLFHISGDLKTNFTISKMRNFQVLFEIMISQFSEGFSFNSFALGPSIRLTKLDSGKFALHTVFINVRFKLGDYFDERAW